MTTTKKPAAAKEPKKPAAAKPATARKKATPKDKEAKKPAAAVVAETPVVVAKEETPADETEKLVMPKMEAGQTIYAVGRRKTAVAQILLSAGNGTVTINKLALEKYFQTSDLQRVALLPLGHVGLDKSVNVKAKTSGGGIHAQAESVRHAIARALIILNPESRRMLKKLGFLTRDPRVKERKKPGLKGARRAPQFSKR